MSVVRVHPCLSFHFGRREKGEERRCDGYRFSLFSSSFFLFFTDCLIAMKNKTDADWVVLCLAGEPDAFGHLIRRHQNYAYGTAIGMLSDFDLAQDVVQDAFLIAYRDLKKLKDPKRFGLWLRGIVRNTALAALTELDRIRVLAQEMSYTSESVVQPQVVDASDSETERRLMVHHALARLGEKNREVVSLYYVGQLSYAKIARFLGITETAVQGRLQRARLQLREELKMVTEHFESEGLPDNFSEEIQRLLHEAGKSKASWEASLSQLADMGLPAVEPLSEALEDSQKEIRHVAAFALCAIGDTRVVQPLLQMLNGHRLTPLMQQYSNRLGEFLRIPGMREELLRLLELDHIRGGAFFVLQHVVGDVEIYKAIERHYHRTYNRMALSTLNRLDAEKSYDLVVASLKSEHPLMRIAGISTAEWQGIVPPLDVCVTAFVRCAKDSRRPKINWGYGALRLIDRHGEEGQKALKKVMDEGHPDLKALAAVSESMRKTEDAFDLLTQAFLGGHRDRRWVSGFWRPLGNFHRRALADWVVEKGDQLAEVPAPLWALALSRKSFERVHPTVERLFEIGTPSVREACVRILARQKGVAVLPLLRDCLAKGKPTRVARRAFHEMREMGDDAVATAQDMFESELWTERRAAVGLLKYWKKLTPEQVRQAKDDAHVGVREAMIR